MWVFHFFMKESVSVALHTRVASKQNDRNRVATTGHTTTLKTYPQAVNYLLRTYATDESVADTKDGISTIIQPSNQTLSQ